MNKKAKIMLVALLIGSGYGINSLCGDRAVTEQSSLLGRAVGGTFSIAGNAIAYGVNNPGKLCGLLLLAGAIRSSDEIHRNMSNLLKSDEEAKKEAEAAEAIRAAAGGVAPRAVANDPYRRLKLVIGIPIQSFNGVRKNFVATVNSYYDFAKWRKETWEWLTNKKPDKESVQIVVKRTQAEATLFMLLEKIRLEKESGRISDTEAKEKAAKARALYPGVLV